MPTRLFLLPGALLLSSALLTGCAREPAEETIATAAEENTESPPAAVLARTPSPDGASVFFITPADGETVRNPIRIEFGISGMAVVKAGDSQPDSGHHHLIIDAGLPALDAPIPADDNYVHFGDASTSTEVSLDPGQHTLQLLLGDHLHVPHDPPVKSEPITITVE